MPYLRMDRGFAKGKKLVSRKRLGEYLWRINSDTLECSDGGGKCGLAFKAEFDTPNPLVNPKPRKFTPAPSGVCRRVYRHGLLWRVTVENIWKSDHATMSDALDGVNPIGVEPGKVEAGVVVVPQ